MWGYTDEKKVLGKPTVTFWKEPKTAIDVIKTLLKKGNWSGELTALRKDGSNIDVLLSANLVKSERGKPLTLMASFVDVSAQKQMEKELRNYSEHLEELVKEKTNKLQAVERLVAIGETAGMVGHDLRNPLQSIILSLSLAKKKLKALPFKETRDIINWCGIVERQVSYMDKIVSDLQSYAKPLNPRLVEIRFHDLINDSLSSIVVPKNVQLSIKIPEDLPKLFVDPELMKRVFVNLIMNAIQAFREGGEIAIKASKTDETVIISIHDTGEGIPKENLSKIFKPLFTTKARGQGFGLPVCKRLIEVHDGSIAVKSEKGKGSNFIIKLPRRDKATTPSNTQTITPLESKNMKYCLMEGFSYQRNVLKERL
jgi:signal transduction histidine kinase